MVGAVDSAGADRLFVGARPALRDGHPSQMHHGVHARQARRRRLAGENIPRRTAERAHRMAILGERLHQIPSDEPGCARYGDVHAVLSNRSISLFQASTRGLRLFPSENSQPVGVMGIEHRTIMNFDYGIESVLISGGDSIIFCPVHPAGTAISWLARWSARWKASC